MFSILLSSQVGQTKHFNWFAVPKYFTNTRRWKRFSASERSQIRLPRGRLGGWCCLGARSPRSAASRTAGLLPGWDWHKPRLAGSRAAAPLPSRGLCSQGFTGTYALCWLGFFLQKAFVQWCLTSPSLLHSLLLTSFFCLPFTELTQETVARTFFYMPDRAMGEPEALLLQAWEGQLNTAEGSRWEEIQSRLGQEQPVLWPRDQAELQSVRSMGWVKTAQGNTKWEQVLIEMRACIVIYVPLKTLI